jgi:hypothetical protein
MYLFLHESGSSVGIMTLFLALASRPALGQTQPPIKCVPGVIFPCVKRPGRESDHTPPSSARKRPSFIIDSRAYTCRPAFLFLQIIIWVVTFRSLLSGQQRFGEACLLHLQIEESIVWMYPPTIIF